MPPPLLLCPEIHNTLHEYWYQFKLHVRENNNDSLEVEAHGDHESTSPFNIMWYCMTYSYGEQIIFYATTSPTLPSQIWPQLQYSTFASTSFSSLLSLPSPLYYTSITNSSLLSLPFPVGTLPSTHLSIFTNLCPILSTSQACLTLKAFTLKVPFWLLGELSIAERVRLGGLLRCEHASVVTHWSSAYITSDEPRGLHCQIHLNPTWIPIPITLTMYLTMWLRSCSNDPNNMPPSSEFLFPWSILIIQPRSKPPTPLLQCHLHQNWNKSFVPLYAHHMSLSTSLRNSFTSTVDHLHHTSLTASQPHHEIYLPPPSIIR